MVKLGFLLTGFNAVMENVILPWKVKREEGEQYNNLQFSTVRMLLYGEELGDLNSPFVSDEAMAEIIVKGLRRRRAGQTPLVETA